MITNNPEKLVRSQVYISTANNSLKVDLLNMLLDIKLKGSYHTESNSLYERAQSVCYQDSFLATGQFVSSEEGI